jgi:hypothetical protein
MKFQVSAAFLATVLTELSKVTRMVHKSLDKIYDRVLFEVEPADETSLSVKLVANAVELCAVKTFTVSTEAPSTDHFTVSCSTVLDFVKLADKSALLIVELIETSKIERVMRYDPDDHKKDHGKLVDVETTYKYLLLKAGKRELKVPVYSADEYPYAPMLREFYKYETLTVDAQDFSDALNRVMPAAAHEDNRPILTGVSFKTCARSAAHARSSRRLLGSSRER